MTAHYMHGWDSGIKDPCVEPCPEDDETCVEPVVGICGDLDDDGWYEFRKSMRIEVLPKPEVPIVS